MAVRQAPPERAGEGSSAAGAIRARIIDEENGELTFTEE